MANFWDTLGNIAGNITGANQANQSATQNAAGNANQAAASTALGGIAGKGAGQFAQEAGQAGQALGQQMGTEAATQGSQAATQAARTAGVNKGQAALLGGQEAGRAFTQGQQTGRGMGMEAYGQGANTQLGGAQSQGTLGTNQTSGGLASSGQGNQATGGLLNAIGGLFSDKDLKKDVKPSVNLEEIVRKIKPKDFAYKPEAGEGDGKQVGVMAQDMEKTPLKENVVQTPEGRVIDTPKQENSNLNLILQLARRVIELEDKQKAV